MRTPCCVGTPNSVSPSSPPSGSKVRMVSASRGGSSPRAIERSRPAKPSSRIATVWPWPSRPWLQRASAPMRTPPWLMMAPCAGAAGAAAAAASASVIRVFLTAGQAIRPPAGRPAERVEPLCQLATAPAANWHTDTPARGSAEADDPAGLLELRLDLVGLLLRHALLDLAGGAVDQLLGLLAAQAGDGSDGLDDLDLLVAGRVEVDREGGLRLLGRRCAAVAGAGAGGRRDGDRGGRGHAERLLERLDALRELEHRDALQLLDPLLGGHCHVVLLRCSVGWGCQSDGASASRWAWSAARLRARPPMRLERVPARPVSGAAMPPASWPSSCSRDGSRARRTTSALGRSSPSSRPPLT